MYRLLIVEDDIGIAKAVSNLSTSWGIECMGIKDFNNVLEEFNEYKPHIVLMDIGLPFMNGYHWCQEIRKASKVPIIFISSAADNMNIIMAMNMGADDFIAKPFDGNVLIAKVFALLRRTYDFDMHEDTLELGRLKLNVAENILIVDEERVELSKNEFRIMFTLMSNKGKVVSREKLMEALWETDSFIDENTLTVNVGRLRKKLESFNAENYIKTKFGVGYILTDIS